MSDLRSQLQAIYDQRGALNPALVVEAATPSNHPLHNRFVWDDQIAGAAYRIDQAHRLIASVRVRYDSSNEPSDVRAFVAVPSGQRPQPDYVPVGEAMADELTARIVLREFKRALHTLQKRYGDLAQFREQVRHTLLGESA